MDQFPFGEPRDLDRLLRYAEASRPHALVVTSRGVTHTEEEDVTLGRVDVALQIARSTESFICVVVAPRPILDAMIRTYGGLLDAIEASGFDVCRRRIGLGRWRRMRIVLGALLRKYLQKDGSVV